MAFVALLGSMVRHLNQFIALVNQAICAKKPVLFVPKTVLNRKIADCLLLHNFVTCVAASDTRIKITLCYVGGRFSFRCLRAIPDYNLEPFRLHTLRTSPPVLCTSSNSGFFVVMPGFSTQTLIPVLYIIV
jgi:hypothetical protein